MTAPKKMGSLGIGAAGELLVQYQLLKHGIDSARLTTDSGIDLVIYVPGTETAATVQVKAMHKPVPAGGKGKPALGFRVPTKGTAQWLACADLSRDTVWLFRLDQREAFKYAKQTPPLLYWYVDDAPTGALREADLSEYRLDVVAARLLAGESVVSEVD